MTIVLGGKTAQRQGLFANRDYPFVTVEKMTDLPPKWVRWPYARIRREIDIEQGEVIRFAYQLEYDVQATPAGGNTPDWRPVARLDHNVDPEHGHDIRDEGLHADIYRNGEKHKVLTSFPPVALSEAPRFSEEFLTQNADRLLEQFERWHDLYGPWRTHESE